MEAGRGGIWAVPLLTPLTSQVVSDTSEASATARQTAATAWRQVICSGKGRDSDREHSGSGREHSSSGSGSGSGSGSVCARALSPPALCAPLPSPVEEFLSNKTRRSNRRSSSPTGCRTSLRTAQAHAQEEHARENKQLREHCSRRGSAGGWRGCSRRGGLYHVSAEQP